MQHDTTPLHSKKKQNSRRGGKDDEGTTLTETLFNEPSSRSGGGRDVTSVVCDDSTGQVRVGEPAEARNANSTSLAASVIAQEATTTTTSTTTRTTTTW